MFKAIRIGILLLILAFVGISTLLTQARSTDWNNSLWVKVYPINADGSDVSQKYIDRLKVEDFTDIETFVAAEVSRYGRTISRPLRVELGRADPRTATADGRSTQCARRHALVAENALVGIQHGGRTGFD